jgi:membrane associated rhomboid family serine protease
MLIPIGHEETSVRRLPWVSFAIMGLCVLAWLLSMTVTSNEAVIEEREKTALRYYFEHPYLDLAEELEGFQYFQMRQLYDEDQEITPPGEDIVSEEQAELDRLTALVSSARDQQPELRWGLIPARFKAHAVITHMFMHAGFWHLFGNMLFFYLAGPYIEDVWGRPLFAVFYLSAGAAAVLGFAWKYPNIEEPLIGASGAVSGAMGAFLVRYWSTKITFFYTLLLKRWTGTFAAPAWIMLSLWFLRELLMAQGLWAFMPGAAGNVAYWAHVFGFAFGVAFALAVKGLRFEERFVDRAIEEQLTVFDNTAVDEAVELARRGRADEAMQLLQAELDRRPDNEDAAAALWHVAAGCDRCHEVAARLQPMLRRAARDGDAEVVQSFWTDMIRAVPEVRVETAVAVRIVELQSSAGYREEAAETVAWLTPRLGPEISVTLLVRLARQADSLHLPEAAHLAATELAHPRLPPEAAGEMQQMSRHRAGPAAQPAAEPSPAPVASTPGSAPEIMEAVPKALAESRLALVAGGTQRTLDLAQVRAIAAAVIEGGNQPKYLVLDLLLDDPVTGAARLRIVRLRSTGFNPQSLVGGDDPLTALKKLLGHLLAVSSARALPDRESVLGRPFRRYRSLQEYEHTTFQRGGR